MSSLPLSELRDEQELSRSAQAQSNDRATVLVCLPSITPEGVFAIASELEASFPHTNLAVASSISVTDTAQGYGRVRMLEYSTPTTHPGWVLTAPDFLAASSLALENKAAATLLLGAEATTLSSDALRTLCAAALEGGGDLVLPRYELGPHEGLVSAAILHPLSRALYGVEVRMPLPLDVAFSLRMASRLSAASKRLSAVPGTEPLLWPAAEAAVSSFVVHEIAAGHRALPQPAVDDLNTLLAQIAGSLFADIESKASFWQRARSSPPLPRSGAQSQSLGAAGDMTQVQQMAAEFRNAFNNLQDIWSLVLPPQSIVALKRLSVAAPEAFIMPGNLWARIVYDFVLAYRLRTINRGHLLGALTPLYLAWAASHLRIAGDDMNRAEQHIEETSAAFVMEKPYIVSRWRWPDRFNP